MGKRVDCAVNVFGKPLQTELALLSLMRHSGKHIDKIYFTNENAKIGNHNSIKNKLSNIEYYETRYVHWVNPVEIRKIDNEDYRLSIRYQYGWEMSDKDYLFITHNDCSYHGDIVGELLENIGDNVAIGHIGQCWNCPASWTGKCRPEGYRDFRPSLEELSILYNTAEPPEGQVLRPYHLPSFHQTFADNPWPLPECRINEWCVLINLSVSRELTCPRGRVVPFGAILEGGTPILDIGVGWFRGIAHLGHRFKNFPIYKFMNHEAGHPAMFDQKLYEDNERRALAILREEYN